MDGSHNSRSSHIRVADAADPALIPSISGEVDPKLTFIRRFALLRWEISLSRVHGTGLFILGK